jgi:hypothetical protein
MKNMNIGDIRPREVTEVEDDKVLSNSNVQASGSHDQNQASTSSAQVEDQQQMVSSQPIDQPSASNQVHVF